MLFRGKSVGVTNGHLVHPPTAFYLFFRIFVALGRVFENVAMFGDLILRLPDITHKVYSTSTKESFFIVVLLRKRLI